MVPSVLYKPVVAAKHENIFTKPKTHNQIEKKRKVEKKEMEAGKQGKHYVLVHGMCQGAWCWFKLTALLKTAGHKVNALDMAASGINMTPIQEVHTFQQYSKPLLDFMASLSATDKIILVGHSLGGLNLAYAMDKFPDKISAAVFLTSLVPDTVNQPFFVMDKFVASVPEGGWLDTQSWSYGSPEDPLTAMLFGPQFLQLLCSHSPSEDFELALALQRPSSTFVGDLSKANKFSNEGYGSVRRVYVICKEDEWMSEAFARLMIENSGIKEVKEIEGADHMPMLSQPQLLCDCLIELAGV